MTHSHGGSNTVLQTVHFSAAAAVTPGVGHPQGGDAEVDSIVTKSAGSVMNFFKVSCSAALPAPPCLSLVV